MDLEFLKARYDFELDRKDELTGALALPVGVLSGLGGLLMAMVRSFSFEDQWTTIAFVGLGVIDAVGFIACLCLFGRAYHAQTYEYLPLLGELDIADRQFDEYNRHLESTGGTVDETFASHLRQQIIRAADSNTESNDRRSKWMHQGRALLFVVLGTTALMGAPYLVDQFGQRLRIEMSKDSQLPTPPAPTPQANQSAPPKPVFPPNRVIREGHEPTTTRNDSQEK